MLFTVYSEEQAKELQKDPFVVGICDYVVVEAKEGRGKTSGNAYTMLTHKVYDKNGVERTVSDFLIDNERMAYKNRHFFYSCGLGTDYENKKQFNTYDYLHKAGKAEIVWRKEKDQNGNVIERLRVKDYIPDEIKQQVHNDFFNDDIDFGKAKGN